MASFTITYLYHSGFAVSAGDKLMIFDYYNDAGATRSLTSGIIDPYELDRYASVDVFVSHSHADHFNPAIYKWASHRQIRYIVSYDIPRQYKGTRVEPGDNLRLGDMDVYVFGSTDLGVSFIIDIGGTLIMHAGDLNLWHWRDESTSLEIEQAEAEFRAIVSDIVAFLDGRSLDVCFFPLDPRQGPLYDAGACFFLMQTHPRIFVPMHFQNRDEVVYDFMRREQQRRTRILALTRRGQQFTYQTED